MIRRDPIELMCPNKLPCRLAALDSRPTSEDDHPDLPFLQTMISQPLACPHVPTPRSHPRCLDPPSDFPNYRAHLQSPPNDTQISSLESNQSLSEDLFPNSPEENVRIATSSILSSTDRNTWFFGSVAWLSSNLVYGGAIDKWPFQGPFYDQTFGDPR